MDLDISTINNKFCIINKDKGGNDMHYIEYRTL